MASRPPAHEQVRDENGKLLCGAHKTKIKAGKPPYCTQPAGYGTNHYGYGRCKHHVGNTPAGIKAAAKAMLAEQKVTFGQMMPIDPGQGLIEEIARTRGWINYLETLLRARGVDEEAIERPETILLELTEDGWAKAAWVSVWQQERQHYARVCKMALDAGIAQRQIELIEQFADRIGNLVMNLIRALGHDPEDPSVREIARAQLALVSGAAEGGKA